MGRIKKEVSFNEQIIYVGIDVHKKSWSVAIYVGELLMKKFSMDPSPEKLLTYLQKNYPGGEYHSVYEAGFCGFWIDRKLRSMGIKNIVVNPADIPTTNKEKTNKTDARDARKLGRELMSGTLEGIYIPKEEEEGRRILSRLSKQLTKDQTRCKNRIKSMLNFLGIQLPKEYENNHWSGNFIKYLEQIEFNQPPIRDALNQLIEQLTSLRKQKAEVVRLIRKMVKENGNIKKTVTHLKSIPGIGETTAVKLYTEIIDINRFGCFDELNNYVGLSPATWSTGAKEKTLGLNQRHNTHLREDLIESAWIAVRQDTALSMAYVKLIKRMKPQEAIIRIAKKLLSRIRYVWQNETDYVFAIVEP
jgi:transposase